MKYYRFPDNKRTNFFIGLLLLLLLLLARDTMLMTCVVGFTRSYVITVAALGLTGLVFLIYNRHSMKPILCDKRMVLLLALSVAYLLPMAAKQDWQLMYFTILLGSCVAIFLSYFVSHEHIARYYVLFMAVLALYSLVTTYFLRDLVEQGLFDVPVFSNSGVRDYYNFLFAFPTVVDHHTRNFGMFREPGVYQFFIILALFLNNWKLRCDKSWKLWSINVILAVTMLTTQSTNGLVELALLVGILFFDKKLYKNKVISVLFASAIILVIGLTIYSVLTKTMLYDYLRVVFLKLFVRSNSATARLESILVDAKFFLANPIFGEKISTVLFAVVDNTTSTMILFAIFGLVGGLLHLAGWVALVWDRSRNILVNLGLLATMLMSFNTQNLTWDIMFWLFPMMALTEWIVPWLQQKGRLTKRK